MTLHVIRSVSVVTHKLIELNETCMDAILKALSTVMNKYSKKKVFSVLKQLKMRECNLIKLLYSCDLHFNVSSESNVVDRQLT